MLCRIDRTSFNWIVLVFPWKNDSLFEPGGVQDANPPNWIVERPVDAADLERMEITESGVVVVEGSGGRREVDTLTLELQTLTG